MAEKFYAVRKGRKSGIYKTWDECRSLVDGFKGAQYKSFATREEAEAYLSDTESAAFVSPKKYEACAYVDGSFRAETGEFSYGMVVLRDGKEICFSEKFDDKELAAMRNVAGEIKGAQAAMQYALDEGLDEIAICHDYAGISKWCLGEWKAEKRGTMEYKRFYDGIRDKVKVKFIKVKAHSNDKYNDMADALAKDALKNSHSEVLS